MTRLNLMLVAAGIYNIAWGAWVVLLPTSAFSLLRMELPNYLFLWQCIGMIVGVYGIGYLIAATDPKRHWPIVLVGFLGKIFGPLGYLWGVATGTTPIQFGMLIITNDLIWLLPFAALLKQALLDNEGNPNAAPATLPQAFETALLDEQETLGGLSDSRPLLVVFLRHAGCTFCRETIADLAKIQQKLQQQGLTVVLVFQGRREATERLIHDYGLLNAKLIADPDRRLYEAFELRRGSLGQLFNWRVWCRGITAILRGHGVGSLDGDGFQLPGVFLVHKRKIVQAFRHEYASDRPDYCSIASCKNIPSAKDIKNEPDGSST